jgi:hypothetical protein
VADPAVRFPHPLNAGILAYLREGAVLSAAPGVYNVDEYVLRCHPDLMDAFEATAGARAPHCRGAAYGYPVLARRGVIFGVAMSMRHMAFRLPDGAVPVALAAGGTPEPRAGDGWVVFGAWDTPDLAGWCARAFAHAVAIEGRHGSAGAPRASGGPGGHVGAPQVE